MRATEMSLDIKERPDPIAALQIPHAYGRCFTLKYTIYFVYVCVDATCVQMLAEVRRWHQIPGAGISGSCEPPDKC